MKRQIARLLYPPCNWAVPWAMKFGDFYGDPVTHRRYHDWILTCAQPLVIVWLWASHNRHVWRWHNGAR